MKTFRCTNCGFQLERPTQPYSCPECGRQAVGLFKLAGKGAPPPGAKRQPPAQPTGPPVEQQSGPRPPHGGISPIAAAPPPPGGPPPPRPTSKPTRPSTQPTRPAEPSAPRHREATKPHSAAPSAPAAKPRPSKPKRRVRPKPIRPKEFVWAYPPEPPYEDQARPMKNAPAVDSSGRILLVSQGRLVALVQQDEGPKLVWEYVVGCHVPGPVVLADDGNLRLHAGDGFLHCVTPEGKQAWAPAHVGEPLGWAAPVVDQTGNTWISAYDGGLMRVDAEGKTTAQRYFPSRRKFDSAGIIRDGVLYIGSEEGYVFAVQLDPDRGRNIWDHASEQGYAGGCVNSSPAMTHDGVLVVAARDETLYGFDPGGQTAWSTKMPGQMLASPVIDRFGHVHVGVSRSRRGQQGRGMMVSVDGNSHQIRWQYDAAGPVESTPVIGDDDIIYFGDNAGVIHAVDSRGKAQWTAQVEAAVRSAGTIIAPERLAFGLDDDTLVVLKCSSKGLAATGWPKIARTLAQSGTA